MTRKKPSDPVYSSAWITCERDNCQEPAYCKVAYLNKYLCLEHEKELGYYDSKGKLADKRIKRGIKSEK